MVWDEPVHGTCRNGEVTGTTGTERARGPAHCTVPQCSPLGAPLKETLEQIRSLGVRGWKLETIAIPWPPQITSVLDHNDSYHLVITQSITLIVTTRPCFIDQEIAAERDTSKVS